ncbi:hypothetical protein ACF0H5_015393 [Mactra antiquata]
MVIFYLTIFFFQIMYDISAGEPTCPVIICDPRTAMCPHRVYYTMRDLVCPACNICIKPGSPVDTEGCPQLPCKDNMPPGTCFQPWVRDAWITYDGRKCPTCESRLCHFHP